MTTHPQFRLVWRGYDPGEVVAKLGELDSALVAARRTAAERATDATHAQEKEASLRAALDDALVRLSRADTGGAARCTDLGPRVSSILRLADEEAAQIRAKGERYAAEVRLSVDAETQRASRRQEAKIAATEELMAGMLEEATNEAERLVEAARAESAVRVDQAQATLSGVSRHTDELVRQLSRLYELLSRLDTELAAPMTADVPGPAVLELTPPP